MRRTEVGRSGRGHGGSAGSGRRAALVLGLGRCRSLRVELRRLRRLVLLLLVLLLLGEGHLLLLVVGHLDEVVREDEEAEARKVGDESRESRPQRRLEPMPAGA